MAGTVVDGFEGNCPPPGFARGLTAVGIVDGGTGGCAMQGVGSTHVSSKAATGIHAQADTFHRFEPRYIRVPWHNDGKATPAVGESRASIDSESC